MPFIDYMRLNEVPCRRSCHFLHLQLPQFIELAFLFHQLFVRSELLQAAFSDNRNMVRVLNRGKPVRHNERCPVFDKPFRRRLDFFFGNAVERRCGLVQNHWGYQFPEKRTFELRYDADTGRFYDCCSRGNHDL